MAACHCPVPGLASMLGREGPVRSGLAVEEGAPQGLQAPLSGDRQPLPPKGLVAEIGRAHV